MTLCNSVKERLFSHYALFHTQLINVFHYLQTLPLVTLLHFMSCHSIQIGCFLNVFFMLSSWFYTFMEQHTWWFPCIISSLQNNDVTLTYAVLSAAKQAEGCVMHPLCGGEDHTVMSFTIFPLLPTPLRFSWCPIPMVSNVHCWVVKTAA